MKNSWPLPAPRAPEGGERIPSLDQLPVARTPVPRTLFVGLPGRMADVAASIAMSPGPLPWLLDRTPVREKDLVAASYRPFQRGRPRATSLARTLVAYIPEVLSHGGSRPEDSYVTELSARDPTGPLQACLRDLVLRPDLVVVTAWAGQRVEWNLPIAPDVACLQLFHDELGRTLSLNVSPWAERRCGDCIEEHYIRHRSTLRPHSVAEVVGRIATGWSAPPPSERLPAWTQCSCWWGGA
ncbi:hypothetical protein [Kocuria massiliensis]|uniref:hypothetical protein n=1 Tax=Kocuria massiliensis TaxID=1926282 RepID=UPI0022B9CB57|nr:hypothetical protein [Kocuria massiliensis]